MGQVSSEEGWGMPTFANMGFWEARGGEGRHDYWLGWGQMPAFTPPPKAFGPLHLIYWSGYCLAALPTIL